MPKNPEEILEHESDYLNKLDILDRLHRLPDSVALTTIEAAVVLRSSVSKLESLRATGSGPTYIQGGSPESRGTNQPCLYEKADLFSWLRSQKVASVREAAIRKEQL